MRRSGQLSIVLIVVVVVVFALISYLGYLEFIRSHFDRELFGQRGVDEQSRVFRAYVQRCLDDAARDMIELSARQGGYIFDDQVPQTFPLNLTSNETPRMVVLFDSLNESSNFSRWYNGSMESVYERYNITVDVEAAQKVYIATFSEKGRNIHVPYFVTVDPNDPPLPIYPCRNITHSRHYCNFNSNISVYPEAANMRYGLKHMLRLEPRELENLRAPRGGNDIRIGVQSVIFQPNYSVKSLLESAIAYNLEECILDYPRSANFEIIDDGRKSVEVIFGDQAVDVVLEYPHHLRFDVREASAASTRFEAVVRVPFSSVYNAIGNSVDYELRFAEFRLAADTMKGEFSYTDLDESGVVQTYKDVLRSREVAGLSVGVAYDVVRFDDLFEFEAPLPDTNSRFRMRFLRQNRPPVLNWLEVPKGSMRNGTLADKKVFGEIGAGKGNIVKFSDDLIQILTMPGKESKQKRDVDIVLSVGRQRQPTIIFAPPSAYDPDDEFPVMEFEGWLVESRGVQPVNSTFSYQVKPAQMRTNPHERLSRAADAEYADSHMISFEVFHKTKSDEHFDCEGDNCQTCLKDSCSDDPDECGDLRQEPVNRSYYTEYEEGIVVLDVVGMQENSSEFFSIPAGSDEGLDLEVMDVLVEFFQYWSRIANVSQNFTAKFEDVHPLDVKPYILSNGTMLIRESGLLKDDIWGLLQDMYYLSLINGVRSDLVSAYATVASSADREIDEAASALRAARVLAQQGDMKNALRLLDEGTRRLDGMRDRLLKQFLKDAQLTKEGLGAIPGPE